LLGSNAGYMSYNAPSVKTALTQQEIYSLVAADLERVEEELEGYSKSSVGPISEIGRHLIDAGGKRVRPALLLLTARMLGEVSPSTIRMAAVVELIHNATLVHDDVIDESDTRRGRPSANTRWGNPMAVLAGDWLYMQSFAVALEEKSFGVLTTLIGITQKMVEGELLQLTALGRSDVSAQELLDIAERKTAYLFSGCMRLPAILAGEDSDSVENLTRIGMDLGMSFQLVDDLLDLTSTREAMGKPVASDLKEGKVTLPLYYAMEADLPDVSTKIQQVLDEGTSTTVAVEEIIGFADRVGAVDRARDLATQYAGSAIAALESFPQSVYRDAIVNIPEFILNRRS
jgi:octaprenyl-diphosphate synthase